MAAWVTFSAFAVCGLVPLIPYILGGGFALSTAMTAAVFFAIGSAKARWSLSPWWRSGAETLTIGLAAAGLAYAVGHLLRGLVGDAGV